MTFAPRRYGNEYQAPAKDSPRAKAQIALLLVSARHLRNITAEGLAATYSVSVETAAAMIAAERKRRGE
jgi:hypothetical protein